MPSGGTFVWINSHAHIDSMNNCFVHRVSTDSFFERNFWARLILKQKTMNFFSGQSLERRLACQQQVENISKIPNVTGCGDNVNGRNVRLVVNLRRKPLRVRTSQHCKKIGMSQMQRKEEIIPLTLSITPRRKGTVALSRFDLFKNLAKLKSVNM